MIGTELVALSEAADGDLRSDQGARDRLSARLGVSGAWAVVDQVHSATVVDVEDAGVHGAADGLFTTEADLPLAVFTADCLGVALVGPDAVGVAHAGWRGAADGVVAALRRRFDESGHPIRYAVIGPHIRSCCFEVGEEVAERFGRHVGSTDWGTPSVDLAGFVRDELAGIEVHDFTACTRHDEGWFSHRRDGDPRRLATIVTRRSGG